MPSDPRQRAPLGPSNARTLSSLESQSTRRPLPVRGHTSPEGLASQPNLSSAPAVARLVSRRPEHQAAPYAPTSLARNPPRLPHFNDLIRDIANVRIQESSHDEYADARRLPPLRGLTSSPTTYEAPPVVTQPSYGANYAGTGLPTPPLERRSPAHNLRNEALWETLSSGSDRSHGSSSSSGTADSFTDGHKWEEYAQRRHRFNGPVSYSCLWRNDDGMCEYNGKKQLVKRHIENVHLKIRRHTCPICGKCFAQKTGLTMHISGHTGDKPLRCRYEPCPACFRDPARRHRHYCNVHGHQPRQSGRNYANALNESCSYESMQPWSAGDGHH
ncbi:hypothetical protein HDZ31DRAFT_80581 [Schizophyllum fasciatum]